MPSFSAIKQSLGKLADAVKGGEKWINPGKMFMMLFWAAAMIVLGYLLGFLGSWIIMTVAILIGVLLIVLNQQIIVTLFKIVFLIFVIPVAIVYVFVKLQQLGIIPMQYIGLANLFAILFYIIILALNEGTQRYAASLVFLAIFSLAFIFIINPEAIAAESPIGQALQLQRESLQKLYYKVLGVPKEITTYTEQLISSATGEYYGKVDRQAKEKLGVFLQDVKSSQPFFYENDIAVIYTTLAVKALGVPVTVTVSCNADTAKAAPKVRPKNVFSDIQFEEEQDIDCVFPKSSFSEGVHNIKFTADFNFKTRSYLKSYFIDKALSRSLKSQNINPLDQYGIKDKNPIAIYTAGPVSIGMGLGPQPKELDREEAAASYLLGININNNWDGFVSKIERIALIVPKGFTMEDYTDYGSVTQAACTALAEDAEGCDDSVEEVYIITLPYRPEGNKVESYLALRYGLGIKGSDYDTVLGKSPIATKYFKLIVDYNYHLEKSIAVSVRKTPEGVGK